jgi:hypothetical protein
LKSKDRELVRRLEEALTFRRGIVASWTFNDSSVPDSVHRETLKANVIELRKAAGAFRAAQNLLKATA